MEPESSRWWCWQRLSGMGLVGRSRDVTLRAGFGLLRWRRGGFSWRQRQLRGAVQHLPFLRRELAETTGLDFPLAHLRWHGAQGLDRISHRLAAVGRQILELRVGDTELLLLLLRQVLPGLHALQDLLLAFWRQAVEALKSLLELLLPVRGKTAKIPIVLEGLSLLIERLIAVLVQPLT